MEIKIMGIDVDSQKLKSCVVIDRDKSNAIWRDFDNQEKAFANLLKFIHNQKVIAVLMEATGGYEQRVALYLAAHKVQVYIVNPLRVRSFAKGIGLNYKNDKIDAFAIGYMGQVAQLPPSIQYTSNHLKIKQLVIRRIQLKKNISQEKNRIKLLSGEAKESVQRHIQFLEDEVSNLDTIINKLIALDEQMTIKKKVFLRFIGIGEVTANAMIALLPELGYITNKKISSLVGLAPMDKDSGTLKGKRSISGGRFCARNALYMPAWVAVKFDKKMEKVYKNLVDRGKAPKVAIVAIMRKMLVRMNAAYRDYLRNVEEGVTEEKEKMY